MEEQMIPAVEADENAPAPAVADPCAECVALSAELERLMSHVRKAGDALTAHFESHEEPFTPAEMGEPV